jgi:hypothetical protein
VLQRGLVAVVVAVLRLVVTVVVLFRRVLAKLVVFRRGQGDVRVVVLVLVLWPVQDDRVRRGVLQDLWCLGVVDLRGWGQRRAGSVWLRTMVALPFVSPCVVLLLLLLLLLLLGVCP